MRMYGIDAPEMPGACRPGRACTLGDPYASRDHLAKLTAGKSVRCEQKDTDVYGRRVVRCTADAVDLSCAMVADGYAVERYAPLNCNTPASRSHGSKAHPKTRKTDFFVPDEAVRPGRVDPPQPIIAFTAEPGTKLPYIPTEIRARPNFPWLVVVIWLLAINIATYVAFAIDKHRAVSAMYRPVDRIPEKTLLTMAALGGSIGAITAQQRLRHKTRKQPFATWLFVITGMQVGGILGFAAWILLPS